MTLDKTVSTDWAFASTLDSGAQVAAPYSRLGASLHGDTHPCYWQPIIYLGYDPNTALNGDLPGTRPLS
ncbi:hypothetical protein [Planotetraspora sp. GP83]|uniref:hypothetical protein n=1 Tax=Planotetraspora sp. GP83 TaxID=3156264 RepID=UPI003512D57A